MYLPYQLLELLVVLILLSGCILLHLRLRRASTLSLLAALSTAAVWMMLGEQVLWQLVPSSSGNTTAAQLDSISHWQSLGDNIGAALALWISFSFLFAVRAVRPSEPAA